MMRHQSYSRAKIGKQSEPKEDLAIKNCIPNHFSPALSELDLMIARSVPPGGNWKNIPESVPSQRLRQIRESFAAGKGSRSTYYGRLRSDAPSYTISTYISRPGNGCHIHYDYSGGQHRVISQREAARLQSFPDSFVFKGSRNAVNHQIGNAVPPLLAYQIAKSLPYKGQFIDLFCGAGGMALGFIWAGWEPIVANDIEGVFVETYKANIHDNVITGDIRDQSVFDAIIEKWEKGRRGKKRTPLFVLGGPPCQGFSTAGNRRSMDDERNWLFTKYKAILEAVNPTGFVFENVPGLLNMDGGRVYEMISAELKSVTKALSTWRLSAESYAIPQRRMRLILVGDSRPDKLVDPPMPVTQYVPAQASHCDSLAPAITVGEAFSDLPPLSPGEDGSSKDYVHEPKNSYQELVRSRITPEEYLAIIRRRPYPSPRRLR
jgi:DNA (cytosine-5)-methyltransferase 1